MTEAEWNECVALAPMREFLRVRRRASNRKFWLFTLACYRRVWDLLRDEIREAVEVAERYADGLAAEEELRPLILPNLPCSVSSRPSGGANPAFAGAVRDVRIGVWEPVLDEDPSALDRAASFIQSPDWTERHAQASLLRDLFGNPFRPPPTIEPSWLRWNDGLVVRLARSINEGRILPSGELDLARLALLADALADAGCHDADLLDHLRSVGPHVKGCWAVDSIVGRK